MSASARSGHLSAGASGSTIGRASTAPGSCLGTGGSTNRRHHSGNGQNRARFAGYEQIFNRSCNQMGDNRPYARGRSSNFIQSMFLSPLARYSAWSAQLRPLRAKAFTFTVIEVRPTLISHSSSPRLRQRRALKAHRSDCDSDDASRRSTYRASTSETGVPTACVKVRGALPSCAPSLALR